MDLLQQIQMGKQLRSSTDPNSPRGAKAKEEDPPDLLAQIRGAGGIGALKKVNRDEAGAAAAAKKPADSGNSIATAMEQYRRLVADSDSDDSDSASDDDWSD